MKFPLARRQPEPHYAYLPATAPDGGIELLTVTFRPGVDNQPRAYAVCPTHGADEHDCERCWMASEVRTRYLIETVRKAHDAYGERGYVAGWRD